MGLYQYDSTEDKLNLVAGSTNFSDAPVGAIFPFGGTDIPISFLLCDGSAVSRTDYADLFNVIGTAFGTGDGSTTFNLPDLRGEFLRGAGTNSHSGQGNGGAVGEHQDATKLPNIYLSANATLIVTPDKNSLFNQADASTGESTGYKGVAATSAGGDHIAVNLTTRPTNTSVNYIIKAKQVGVPADFLAEVGEVYQKKDLATPITIGGASQTTVEDALGAIVSDTFEAYKVMPQGSDADDFYCGLVRANDYYTANLPTTRATSSGQLYYTVTTVRESNNPQEATWLQGYQIAVHTSGNKNITYTRTVNGNNGWSSWAKIVTESELNNKYYNSNTSISSLADCKQGLINALNYFYPALTIQSGYLINVRYSGGNYALFAISGGGASSWVKILVGDPTTSQYENERFRVTLVNDIWQIA